MEQNDQGNSFPYSTYEHGDVAYITDDKKNYNSSNNNNNNKKNINIHDDAGSIMTESPQHPFVNKEYNMMSPLNSVAALSNNDMFSEFDNEYFGSGIMENLNSNSSVANNASQKVNVAASHRVRARGRQAAHTVGPTRGNIPRGMTTNHPYSRPQHVPSRSQGQSQAQAQRRLSRHAATGETARQIATNAYTLPRSKLNALDPRTEEEMFQGMRPAFGPPAAPGAGSSSGSTSPFNPTDAVTQAPGSDADCLTGNSTKFVRPVHQKLDSSRIDPAGPEAHPDPSWRAPGPHQWFEILHNYTLLQYLSDATIKDLLKHCDRLVGSGAQDPTDPIGPALVEGGPYTVLDAQAVWNYCTAYSKRRQQHRNNSAASRSRNNKAAQLKHWRALALAAGAPDRDFVFDINDAGNAPGAPSTLLAAVTQVAIDDMQNGWVSTMEAGGLASAATHPPHGFATDQMPQSLNHNFAQAIHVAMATPSLDNAHPSSTVHQGPATTAMSASSLPVYHAAPPPMAAPSALTTSTVADTYQSPDVFEDFKLDLLPLDDNNPLEQLSNKNPYMSEFEFCGGNF